MTDDHTTFDDHDPLAQNILQVLESFIDEIGNRNCTGHFDKVVNDRFYLKGKHLIQKPERFIEEYLVFPLLTGPLDYDLRPQPKQYAPRWPKNSGIPDFCITTLPIGTAMDHEIRFFGEVKPPKKIQNARNDMKEYFDTDLGVHAIAILTDGFEWELWYRPKNHSTDQLDNPYANASLREALKTVRIRNLEMEKYRPHQVRKMIESDGFSKFKPEAVESLINEEFELNIPLYHNGQID